MAHTSINESSQRQFALFDLGFRPFFLAAGCYGLVAMVLWALLYHYDWGSSAVAVAPSIWHAHEMIFGYVPAVIAGFLLTAVANWTGLPTPSGYRLASIVLLWLSARIAFWLPGLPLAAVAILDSLFWLALIVSLATPIVAVKQWRQLGVISKLVLFLVANTLFYLGLLGYVEQGVYYGLYSGFYLTLALILVISRRVFAMFIERGVADIQPGVKLRNRGWVDVVSLLLFLVFFVVEVFTGYMMLAAILALILALVYMVRLWDWWTPGILRKPLLWVLYGAYLWLIAGFLLHALAWWFSWSPYIAMHAFAVGGMGLVTMGMMARVSLGHTGRNVFQPPLSLAPMFTCLLLAAILRVFMPLVMPGYYQLWVGASQLLWIIAFGLFVFHYVPVWVRPRVDGKNG